MRYTMTFVLSEDFTKVLLQLKPEDHKNPLFRGKWSVPGGKIEQGESDIDAARRELNEETSLTVGVMRFVLMFRCNCDPTEPEHEVVVFGTIATAESMLWAQGTEEEPIKVFDCLPNNVVWYLSPLYEIVLARMRQPY